MAREAEQIVVDAVHRTMKKCTAGRACGRAGDVSMHRE